MNLTIRTQILILMLAAAVGFALGSLAHPKPSEAITTQETKTKEDTHEHTTTIITKEKDGTETTRIDTIKDDDSRSETQTKTVVKNTIVNISVLAGVSIHDPLLPIYGVQITRPVLSSLTVGGYAMTNGVVGVSVGWNF